MIGPEQMQETQLRTFQRREAAYDEFVAGVLTKANAPPNATNGAA